MVQAGLIAGQADYQEQQHKALLEQLIELIITVILLN